MLQSLAVVLAVIIGAGALLKGLSWARRERIVRAVDADSIVRSARGVSLKVLTQGETTLPGMSSSRANRTSGDLILTADRFLIGSARGVLVDIRPGRRRLASARTTGPGRLVIEGDSPSRSGAPGGFRIELVMEDARAWVEALTPFVTEDAEFASIPQTTTN